MIKPVITELKTDMINVERFSPASANIELNNFFLPFEYNIYFV